MVGIRQKEKNNERNECINERSTTKKLTNESEHGHDQFLMRVLKGGGVPVAFHSPFFFEIPLPSAQIPFPLAEFGKNPSVIHTTSFRFASAKLRLLNTTQQRPKNSQGFTKMF